MRIGIVGGGVAGLVAAFELRRLLPPGDACEIHLFEAAGRLGGTVQTSAVDGYLLEHGADMFACQPAAALQLCEHLGLTSQLIRAEPTARGAAIVHRGNLIRVPDGFVLMRPTRVRPMLTTPLLSLAGKMRLLSERWVPPLSGAEDESVAQFATRRLGGEVYRRLVQPLVGGIYTGNCDELSMAATMPQFWKMEQEDGSLWAATRRRRREGDDQIELASAGARYDQFRSLPGGNQQLLNTLTATLPAGTVHTGCRVTSVTPWQSQPGSGWRITIDGSGPPETAQPFDHVIIAAPAAAAAKLLSTSDQTPIAQTTPAQALTEITDRLASIGAASSAVVALGVRSADLLRNIPIAGFVVPQIENRPILAASFTSDKFPGRAPDGQRLIRVFFGGRLNPEVLQRDDAELIQIARQQLGELIGLVGTPILAQVIRWHHAMPQYTVGHQQRVGEIETRLDELPGLHLAGNSYSGVGLAPTIARSQAIGRRIMAGAADPNRSAAP